MHTLLSPLLLLQRFIIPALLILLAWSAWRVVFKKDLAIGLGVYAALVVVVDGFYNTGIFLPGMAQGSIRYSEVCALFLFTARPAAPRDSSYRNGVLLLFGLYFTLLVVAALRASPVMQGVFDFRRIIIPQLLGFVLAYRGLTTLADYRRFLLTLTGLMMIVGLFQLFDVIFDRWILHSDMLGKPEYYHNRKRGRYGSIFLNPNLLGAFVVLMTPAVLALVLREQVKWIRAYLVVVLLFLMFCLVETQSRAPLAAMGACIVIFVLGPVGGISRGKRFGAVAAAIGLFAIIMPGFFTHAVGRFDTLEAEKSEEEVSRASMWIYTRGIISEHPLLGIGFGEKQFIAAMHETDFQRRFGRDTLDNPHNSYLQGAVYAGIPCMALFVLANLLMLIRAGRIAWSAQNSLQPPTETFGLAVAVLGFMLSMYPDMHLFTANLAPLYWMLAGLLLAFTTRLPALAQAGAPTVEAMARTNWLTPAWRRTPAIPQKISAPPTNPEKLSSKSSS